MLSVLKYLMVPLLLVLCTVISYSKDTSGGKTDPVKTVNQAGNMTNLSGTNNVSLTNIVTNRAIAGDQPGSKMFPFSFDLTAGAFFPVFSLGSGMSPAFLLALNGFIPVTTVVPSDLLKDFDVGVSFFLIPGTAVNGRNAGILFLGAMADAYYRVPFGLPDFDVYVLFGMGITSSSAWIANGTSVDTAASADFVIRPGIGCRWNFMKQWYARLDVAYFMAFEKISATGLPVALGVGYEF